MITGRDMKTPIAPSQVSLEIRPVADVTLDALERSSLQTSRICAAPEQGPDAVTSSRKLVDQVGPDESGSAGDEAVHGFHDPSTPSVFNPIFGNAFELAALNSARSKK
jgi:hypothetical protein